MHLGFVSNCIMYGKCINSFVEHATFNLVFKRNNVTANYPQNLKGTFGKMSICQLCVHISDIRSCLFYNYAIYQFGKWIMCVHKDKNLMNDFLVRQFSQKALHCPGIVSEYSQGGQILREDSIGIKKQFCLQ